MTNQSVEAGPTPRRESGIRSRDFALFFTARAAAKLGDMMLPVALAVGLVQHGHGAGAVGAVMACYSACFAGFVILGGVIADRVDTRKLMVAADLVRVGSQAIAAVLFLTDAVVLWQLCAISVVNGVCAALFQPGVASTVPRIARDVQAANGAIRTVESVMTIAGPAVAAVLIGLTSVGGVFVLHAATYLVSAGCLLWLRLAAAAPREPRRFHQDLAGGWREFRARTWMWTVILFWMTLQVTVFGPTMPLVATEIVATEGDTAYGIVNAAMGVGMVAGGLLAMRLRPRHPLRAGALALLLFCLQPLGVGLHLPVGMLMVMFAVAGVGQAFWGVMWATSVQTQVPGTVLNRIHAYEVAGSLAMAPVGQAIAGPASSVLGVGPMLLTSAVVAVVLSGTLAAVPAVRRLERVAP
jgi:MFS family permease